MLGLGRERIARIVVVESRVGLVASSEGKRWERKIHLMFLEEEEGWRSLALLSEGGHRGHSGVEVGGPRCWPWEEGRSRCEGLVVAVAD